MRISYRIGRMPGGSYQLVRNGCLYETIRPLPGESAEETYTRAIAAQLRLQQNLAALDRAEAALPEAEAPASGHPFLSRGAYGKLLNPPDADRAYLDATANRCGGGPEE